MNLADASPAPRAGHGPRTVPSDLDPAEDRGGGLDLEAGLALEWLETDGRGGYASSTPFLCPTRRYHGLLVAPFAGTAERYVFLARFDEVVREPGGTLYALSTAHYGDGVAPEGWRTLERFALEPHPVFEHVAGDAVVRREVRMVSGRHAVLVRYTLVAAGGERRLELRPLLPYRRADHLTIENDAVDTRVVKRANGVRFRPYASLPPLTVTVSRDAAFDAEPTWYRDVVFEADRRRGYDGREDELSPGVLVLPLAPGESTTLAASVECVVEDPERAFEEASRRPFAGALDRSDDALAKRLDRAGEAFLQRDGAGRLGVVAGFPWFLEWGRDTFLALPGLTLARGRADLCREALVGALPYLEGGLLPNVFGTSRGDSHYGSADAALWFARAALLYDRAGGDAELVEGELGGALASIAEAYLTGADLGLHVDGEGGLRAGAPDLNPTWMDARTSAGPVTPRHGAPVELAALWHQLVAFLEELAERRGDGAGARAWRRHRRAARRTFQERYWLAGERRLADNWREGEPDRSVRPNMALAASLELAPLSKAQRRDVVRCVEERLLTPVGLRTLDPADPAYAPRYEGGPEERDGAYHQGTVWPWLLGPYTEAVLRAATPTRARLARLRALWDGLAGELDRAGLEHVSEVFDGDPPHRPGGTIAQAWNTAEWLRARAMIRAGFAPEGSPCAS